MLNELYTLERSLKRFKVGVEESHPWVKRLGRASLLICGVDASGLPASFDIVDKQASTELYQIQRDFHSSFPKTNWDAPVWHLEELSPPVREWLACPKEDIRRRVDLLRKACAGATISGGQKRACARMQQYCGELMPRFGDEDAEFAAFRVLMERLARVADGPDEWIRKLSDAALGTAESGGPEMLSAVEDLLAGKFDGKKAKVPILFDLADCTTYRCRVASPRMGGYFSRRLNMTEARGEEAGRCALSGFEMPLETDKTPSPRLPVLGDAVLMSMNPDTRCQARYGRIGMQVFPLGKKTAADLNTALVHLTAADREGKNWKRIPGRSKKKFNLLIAYLETVPHLDAAVAVMFSGPDESGPLYDELCSQVFEALRAVAANDSDLLRVIVLNKIDPGRVQVELSEAFTAGQVIEGGREWKEGCRNRPLVAFKDDGLVPSPADAMACLQMQWERDGASYAEAPGCRLAEIYDVLIARRETAVESAAALLRLTLARTSDLLIAVGHAAHRNRKETWKRISREAGRHPVTAVSLFGITLSKLGHRKESYMQDAAFLVGRFLSLADTLHAQYCEVRRKGDMPPQLLGNALIPTAVRDPNRGFARMLDRIRIYRAWAGGKGGTGLARWSCAEMGKIASELSGKLPAGRRFSEAEQAQLLLGYLARTESSQEKGSEGANQ